MFKTKIVAENSSLIMKKKDMRANRAHQIFYIVNEIQVSLKIFQEKGVLPMAITKQKT